MTVSELITKLNEYPADLKVVVAGYEGGYDDIEIINSVSLDLYPNKRWWDGKYKDSDKSNATPAVALLGNREPD